jgi:hypothetical protein
MNSYRRLIRALICMILFPTQISSSPFTPSPVSQPCKEPWLLSPTADIPAQVLDQTVPVYAFERRGADPAIIFSRTGSDLEHHPTIFIRLEDSWRLFDLRSECYFQQTNWVHVARHESKVWGIADADVEGRGWTLEVVFSRDGGRSWRHVGSLKKPYFTAEFNSFRMGPKGRGSLTIYLDDSADRSHKRGYYVYSTRDWGQRWTGARYSTDLLSSPDYRFEQEGDADRPIKEVMRELAKSPASGN